MTENTILKTHYFNRPWTWWKRIFIFLGFVFFIMWWEMKEDPWDYWWIKYVLLTALSVGLFLSPVDDIMIDDKFFYHIRTSLLKNFSKLTKYDISTINSIRCLGVHVPGPSFQEMVGTHRQLSTETNTVEISFKDGTYESLELAIYKKELMFYTEKIRERMVENGTQQKI
jgi:hypothetical protein